MNNYQLKNLFKDIRKTSQLEKLFQENNELKIYCENILSKGYFKSFMEYVYFIKNDLKYSFCPVCGKQLTFNQLKRKITYCSLKCKSNSEFVREKTKKSCLEKYGVDNPNKDKNIRKKIEETCLERYGNKNFLSLSNVREQIKETCLEKYGVENPAQSLKIKEQIQKTCLEKYGSSSYVNSIDFKEKSKNTCLEKYGVEHHFNSNEVQNKVKNTLIDRYGVNNAYLLDSVQSVQKEEKFHHSIETIKSFKNFVIPLFDLENEWKGYKNEYKWKCVKCGNVWTQSLYKTSFFPEISNYLPRCLNCYPYLNGFSKSEKELVDFCKQYFPNLKENDRTLIKPLELDIVIDELKLCLEFNGSYWHDVNHVSSGYHLNKVIKCNLVGYRLIHIWEDEWNEQTKQKLINIFEGKETIDYNQKLDRSWYNNLSGTFEELQPEIIIMNGFEVENCGYLKEKYINILNVNYLFY